ncbi:MAG: restriction endonuclease [Acidobacteria bacterium RIFCSPLOWO2_02_FULL_67_36]|nr:MAG: restriction endonuclease [Acidobacteria bacterium RIFCSPLOWO2_02_FULL_67_36]OFW20639.1 MAG: restriction endonuclease [Acidobacteria bacterium RIFCSPLOWO2_12_FULL_66_21]
MPEDDPLTFVREQYEIHDWRHAIAILATDFPHEWSDIVTVLSEFRLHRSHVLQPGGSKSLVAGALDGGLIQRGWVCRSFATRIRVDDQEHDAPTHAVDCFKNGVGLEVEWNNKDPFFDRDFNNFRLLFELRALSVGVIVTRCDELQVIFNTLGRGTSYGNSTTHMSKLLPRLHGGSGGGCPILVLGISKKLYVED